MPFLRHKQVKTEDWNVGKEIAKQKKEGKNRRFFYVFGTYLFALAHEQNALIFFVRLFGFFLSVVFELCMLMFLVNSAPGQTHLIDI